MISLRTTEIQPSSFCGIPLSVDCNISEWHRSREFVVEQDIEGAVIHPPDSVWLVKYFPQCGWGDGLALSPRCTKTLGSAEGSSEKILCFTEGELSCFCCGWGRQCFPMVARMSQVGKKMPFLLQGVRRRSHIDHQLHHCATKYRSHSHRWIIKRSNTMQLAWRNILVVSRCTKLINFPVNISPLPSPN
jgi:hypothetical protein